MRNVRLCNASRTLIAVMLLSLPCTVSATEKSVDDIVPPDVFTHVRRVPPSAAMQRHGPEYHPAIGRKGIEIGSA